MKWRVVMLRKLAVFIVSAGLTMSPLSVQALGFGGVKLKSSLNEKLNAEVVLLSANANDIQSLTIKLATEEAFLRSGIDRTALLNKLKFKVKQHSNGDYYIHLTTSETVREPFMNFLLEMNWKNGRMLREYTMLIDPPGRGPGSQKKIAEPAPSVAEIMALKPDTPQQEEMLEEPVVVSEVEESAPFIEPVEEEVAPSSVYSPEAEIAMEKPLAEPEPELEVEPVAEMAESVLAVDVSEEVGDAFVDDELWPRIPLAAYNKSNDLPEAAEEVVEDVAEVGDLDYGITKDNDNLWNIAEKLRQGDESVSVYQVMMALLKSNPDAFINNNVHRLKVGHVLRIDDPSTLTSLSRKEAAASFIKQTASWNNYRQQVAKTTTVQPIMAGTKTTESKVAPSKSTGELVLSAPDGKSLTAGGGSNEESLNNDLATMQEQLRQAKSDSGTMRTRNVELNNKLQSLEDELNRLQRSLSVKDDELAALQQQLSSLNKKTEQAPVQEKPAVPAPAKEKPVVKTAPETKVVEKKPEPVKSKPITEKVKPKPKAIPVEVTPPAAEEGIMDTIMGVIASIVATATGIVTGLNLGSDSLLFIAAPILLVFLVIAIIVIKRRRQGDKFQESILTGATTAADAGGIPSGDSTTFSEESSFLSDFAMSGASAIEADDSEVDPLTEADVFMAYGRYEAAEERLNEAVQNEPNRMELRAKLLELHHATQNKAAFEAAAEDFYASLGSEAEQNPLWEKAVSLGTEIAPENPLFNQGGGGSAPAAETPAIDDIGLGMTDSQVMDIGLETGVFESADMTGSADTATDDMDFNLDIGGTETGAMEADAEPALDLDFNLDMGTTESTNEAAAEEESAGLDFNLDMGAETATEESAADLDFNLDMGTEETADSGGLDFDLDIGGGEAETDDISLDFDTGGAGDDAGIDLNLDASDTADADLGGGDEVGTKLDLAKAYIDMGDPEGARSILDEVMDEGSSTQKEEAQSLLGQIA